MDPQLASEMVVLLGRELSVVRKRVEDLERELTEEKSSHQVNKKRAEVAEQAMKTLTLNAEKVSRENGARGMKPMYGVKKEENNEIELAVLGAEDIEALTKLREELKGLKEEQKAHREAEADWLKTNNELTNQLNQVTSDKEGLLEHIAERLIRENRIEDGEIPQVGQGENDAQSEDPEFSGEEEEGEEELEATPAIRHHISGFPLIESLPRNRLTLPVALRSKGPIPYLASHIGYGNFFYVPAGCIRWYSDKTHAVTCGPSFFLHQNRWQENVPFSNFFDTTQEVFFARGSTVHYAGTYKCHQPPDFLPQTMALPDDLSVGAIISALRIPNSFRETWADKETLEKLFRHGILKVDYLIMECIGFNHRLFRRMLAQFENTDVEPTNPTKRKHRPQTNPKKKRKVNS